jgi:hypothetical protein
LLNLLKTEESIKKEEQEVESIYIFAQTIVMKKYALLIVVLAAMVAACNTKKEQTNNEVADTTQVALNEWKEMDAYHMLMAEAFHPYKDSSNLEPAKLLAADLVKSAESWINAPLPEKVNNDEVKAKLQELKAGSDALASAVAGGKTEEISSTLTSLHDKFHELQEAWYGGGEGHHDHKH